MTKEKNYLQSLLAGESRAYGFTIAFWGSGATLINAYGVPSIIPALLYGLGAVTGFGVLALAAYGNAGKEVSSDSPSYVVLGMVHYLAALVPTILTYGVTLLSAPETVGFFISGMVVSTTYNVLAVLEEDIVELLERFSLA